jgi:hypothetical protein
VGLSGPRSHPSPFQASPLPPCSRIVSADTSRNETSVFVTHVAADYPLFRKSRVSEAVGGPNTCPEDKIVDGSIPGRPQPGITDTVTAQPRPSATRQGLSHAALRKVLVRYVRLARCPGAGMPHALSRPRRASPRQATLSFAGRVGDVCKKERQQAGGRPALEQLQPPAAPSRVPRSACRSFGRSVCPPPCVAGREERSSNLVRPSDPLVVEV